MSSRVVPERLHLTSRYACGKQFLREKAPLDSLMRVTVTVEIVFLDGRILLQLLDYFMRMLFDILSNSSPSPFQFKSNGQGVELTRRTTTLTKIYHKEVYYRL